MVGMGDWSRGMILVSGTRGPGFNSRIALIFQLLRSRNQWPSERARPIFIIALFTLTKHCLQAWRNNIIMKSCLGNSYYMGISYRSTHRPSLYEKYAERIESNSASVCSLTKQSENEDIIHGHKNIAKPKQPNKNYNPFLARKQSEIKDKKRKTPAQSVEIHEFFKVTKISKTKTQGTQANDLGPDQFAISIVLPPKIEKVSPVQEETHLFHTQPNQNIVIKRSGQENHQEIPIFDHFPSHFSLKNVPTKGRFYKEGRAYASKLSSFFFPTNRIRTENDKSSSKSILKMCRPLSCKPRKKSSTDTRMFNFDGTLQNHKMAIPQRPQTSYNPKSEPRKPVKQARFLNYEDIAKRCIKIKQGKRTENKGDSRLKIRPWVDPEEDKAATDFFDISCSSIRGEFTIQL